MDFEEAADTIALKWKHHGLRLAGLCGIFASVVAGAGVLLAVAAYPGFSWWSGQLLEMGASQGISRILFNNGLIMGGLLAMCFSAGFPLFLKKGRLAKAGSAALLLAAAALVAAGAFQSDYTGWEWVHAYASAAFFSLFPLSALLLAGPFLQSGRGRLTDVSIVLGVIGLCAWLASLALYSVGPNAEMAETVAALAAGAWSFFVGLGMARASDE